MTQVEFVHWLVSEVERSIRNSTGSRYGYVAPSKYREEAEKFLRPLTASIVMPTPYPWGGITNYAKQVWLQNVACLAPLYYTQGKVYNLNKSGSASSNKPTSSEETASNRYNSSQKSSLSNSQYNANPAKSINKNKEGVETAYISLIALLGDIITKFRGLILSNPELNTINNQLISKLSSYLDAINQEKKYALNNMSWDKLVIGFFGETNAGKSTIIESLRILLDEQTRKSIRQRKGNCDGEIVGDGRQDFTQDYNEYNMSIKGQNFMLIDVPGIEGKEDLFKGKIGEALRKAHLIFYVNGRNKNIDGGTAGKIKEYLGDGVKVVVLQNIRGNVSQYEYPDDRKTLMTQSTRTIIESVKRDFRKLVDDKFYTAIPVMGLLSMCAYGEFSPQRDDLSKKQRMLIDLFGEDCHNNYGIARNKIRQFSNIDEVMDLIYSRSHNFKSEIASANFAKMEMFCRRALKEYLEEVDDKKAKFELYRKQVDNFIKENSEEVQTAIGQFERRVQSDIRSKLVDLSEISDRLIRGCQWNTLDNTFKNTKKDIENIIFNRIREYSNALTVRVNERANRLKAIPGFSSISSTINVNFKIDDISGLNSIKDEDDITFGDFLKSAKSTAGGATTGVIVGSMFGPIGALVGGIIGGFGGMVSGNVSAGSDQTERALKKAKEVIDKYKTQTNKQISSAAQNFRTSLQLEMNQVNSIARTRIQEVDKFYALTQSAEWRLKEQLKILQNNGK